MFLHDRSVAVLGAGGFIGSHLVPRLLEVGARVHALDISFDKLATRHERLELFRASLADPVALDETLDGVDTVVSLTALCNPSLYNTRPIEVIDASYDDLIPVCDRCTQRDLFLVHFSTCEVYGRRALDIDGTPTDRMEERETGHFFGPVHLERWTYAAAKHLLERRIWALGRHGGLRFTIIRPFNAVGPRMDFVPGIDGQGIPRVLASFVHALLEGRPLPLVDGGNQRRSFIIVDDLVDATLRVIERHAQCASEILNLGNPDDELSIVALAEMVGRAWVRQLPNAAPISFERVSAHAFYGAGYDDTEVRVPDITRAMDLLDWRPTRRLDEALDAIIADYVARYLPSRALEGTA